MRIIRDAANSCVLYSNATCKIPFDSITETPRSYLVIPRSIGMALNSVALAFALPIVILVGTYASVRYGFKTFIANQQRVLDQLHMAQQMVCAALIGKAHCARRPSFP